MSAPTIETSSPIMGDGGSSGARRWWSRSTWLEKYLALSIFLHLVLISIALRLMTFSVFEKLYTRCLSKRWFENKYSEDQIISVTRGWGRRFPLYFNCLPQALAARLFLTGKQGYALKIGVLKSGLKIEAHAWLERKTGAVLIGNTTTKFVPIYSLGSGET